MSAARAVGASGRTAASLVDRSGLGLDRMPGLGRVLDVLLEQAPAALEPLLGASPKLVMQTVEAPSTRESLQRRAGSYQLLVSCTDPESRFLLILEKHTVEVVISSIFGISLPAEAFRNGGSYTKIEMRLAQELAHVIATQFCFALGEHLSIHCTPGVLQPLTDPTVMGRRDTPALEANLSLSLRAGPATLQLLLPQGFLQAIQGQLATTADVSPLPADPLWQERIVSGLSKTRLPVFAVLEEFEISLGEIAALRVGDIVPLRGVRLGQVRLECAERGVFAGRLSQSEDGYMIQIEGPIVDDEDVSSGAENSSTTHSSAYGTRDD